MTDAAARFGSGRAVARVEDAALLTGRGRFVDNAPEPNQTVIAFQRSPMSAFTPTSSKRRTSSSRFEYVTAWRACTDAQ